MLITGIVRKKFLTLSLAICQFRKAHFSTSPVREVKVLGYNGFETSRKVVARLDRQRK
jgi:hypothetical protein